MGDGEGIPRVGGLLLEAKINSQVIWELLSLSGCASCFVVLLFYVAYDAVFTNH